MKTLLQTIIDDQHTHWEASIGHEFNIDGSLGQEDWTVVLVTQETSRITVQLSSKGETFKNIHIDYKGENL